MKQLMMHFAILVGMAILVGCNRGTIITDPQPVSDSGTVTPVDVNEKGFELLEKMQGHWVGTNRVLSYDYEWFAYDYRAISPSHVHGIYEGGSMGNLFTSFFAADFMDTRTIMARNGGLLNGIYRTSYFVLDSVRSDAQGDYYRLVDAIGGTDIMWIDLHFHGDSLRFDAYTSSLGQRPAPTHHQAFRGVRTHPSLAQNSATSVGFPQNISSWDFSGGFNKNYLYQAQGDPEPKSATFMAQDQNNDVLPLALASGDPFRIDQHPHLAQLQVTIDRESSLDGKTLFLFLSMDPLTDGNGILKWENFDSILLFPDLTQDETDFRFTYLHPGDYYITIVADENEDGTVSQGDVTSISQSITISPESQTQITVDQITHQN